jgi:PhnB protein
MEPLKPFDRGDNSFHVTLQGSDPDGIKAFWDALGAGAAATLVPLAPATFAPLYGMLTDRFGVTWIVGAMIAS